MSAFTFRALSIKDEGKWTKSAGSRHRYRIVAGGNSAAPEIFWLTNERDYALVLSAAIGGRLPNRDASRSVWVEEWICDRGRWRWDRLEVNYVQRALPACSSPPAPEKPVRVKFPKSGDLVQAVLMADRTRRGGWKARLLDCGLIGPITNYEAVPLAEKPDQLVTLRVGAISAEGSRVQFEWPPI